MTTVYDERGRPLSGGAPDSDIDEQTLLLDQWSSHMTSCWRSKMSEFPEGTKFEVRALSPKRFCTCERPPANSHATTTLLIAPQLLNSQRAYLPLCVAEYEVLAFPIQGRPAGVWRRIALRLQVAYGPQAGDVRD